MEVKDILQNNINTQKEILDYIEDLERKLKKIQVENEHNSSFYIFPKPLLYLYHPILHLEKLPKCNKCDRNGLILVDDSFSKVFDYCECNKEKYTYLVKRINVISYSFSNNEYIYTCSDDGRLIVVNDKNILSEFGEEQLYSNIETVFYNNENSCQNFCRRKNNEQV